MKNPIVFTGPILHLSEATEGHRATRTTVTLQAPRSLRGQAGYGYYHRPHRTPLYRLPRMEAHSLHWATAHRATATFWHGDRHCVARSEFITDAEGNPTLTGPLEVEHCDTGRAATADYKVERGRAALLRVIEDARAKHPAEFQAYAALEAYAETLEEEDRVEELERDAQRRREQVEYVKREAKHAVARVRDLRERIANLEDCIEEELQRICTRHERIRTHRAEAERLKAEAEAARAALDLPEPLEAEALSLV